MHLLSYFRFPVPISYKQEMALQEPKEIASNITSHRSDP